jgi:hypothetical protein
MTQAAPIPPTTTVIERLGAVLVRLVMDITSRVGWGGISQPASSLLFTRLSNLKRRIDRIVARIRAGTYKPRRSAAARASPGTRRPPRPASPLPATFGWLMPLIPRRREEYWHANGVRDDVETMLNDPEMLALVAVAPVSLGRPLRSLCWAFRIKPPPFLAPPRRGPKPPTTPPAAPAASPQAAPAQTPPPERTTPPPNAPEQPRQAAPRRRPPPAAPRPAPHPA